MVLPYRLVPWRSIFIKIFFSLFPLKIAVPSRAPIIFPTEKRFLKKLFPSRRLIFSSECQISHEFQEVQEMCFAAFSTSYLYVKTTFASNWWLIIAYQVSATSAEHICFRRKYFFLGIFGSPTWLRKNFPDQKKIHLLRKKSW